ncbi:MAG: hypothetical protein MZU97_04655 [Bacillus subtilis]|nr:hypothetical protein [Bacillus subtilis]
MAPMLGIAAAGVSWSATTQRRSPMPMLQFLSWHCRSSSSIASTFEIGFETIVEAESEHGQSDRDRRQRRACVRGVCHRYDRLRPRSRRPYARP